MAARLTLFALAVWLILVHFCSNFANAKLTIHPTDTVILVNQPTYFNCSTSTRNIDAKDVLWYHYTLNSGPRKDVYDDGQIMDDYKDRFGIETNLSTGMFNLVVNWPSLADAGRYECGDGKGHGDKASAELIILEGNPICESNMPSDGVVGQNSCGLKPDDLWLTCRITFQGNTPPMLKWKTSYDESSSPLAACERSSLCNLMLRGDLISNGQSFVCHTTKSKEQYGCSTAPITVKYAMSRTEEITETKGAVVCSSNTSQPCTYKWYNAKNEEVSLDEDLHTTDPGEYKCEAQCEMNRRNESCRFTAMRVYVISPDKRLYALLVLLSIPMICVVVFCMYKWFVQTKDNAANKKPVKEPDTLGMASLQENHLLLMGTESLLTEKTPAATDTELTAGYDSISKMATSCEKKNLKQLITDDIFIGKGAFGDVFGPCVWKDKICAVKKRLCEAMETCKKEQEACEKWMSLHHNNLITVYDISFESLALYVVMEYGSGGSLKRFLERCTSAFPVQILMDWSIQIAQGMAYLHQKNIVHRDLKSPNIIIMEPDAATDPYGKTLKIIDFDQIRNYDHTIVMSIAGSYTWIAPEVLDSGNFCKASDVWSYGVVLWEMSTREVPYKGVSGPAIASGVINRTCKLTVPDLCPDNIRIVLEGCLHYERGERPTFDDILSTLQYSNDNLNTPAEKLPLLPKACQAIYGLAVLGQEVFIVRLLRSDIEVYDSITFRLKRRMEVKGMKNPENLVSCSLNKCLYAFDWDYQEQNASDWDNQGQTHAILRIDPTNGKIITTWKIDGRGGRLSVASDTNVILNINYKAKLHEYTADGELIREIDLDPMCTDIIRSWHALKLDNGQFVVCHGGEEDPLSRVCLLSVKSTNSNMERTDEAEIVNSFGSERGKSIDRLIGPTYLSVDNKGTILVSDASHQTVLLSSNLDEPQIIVSEEHGLMDSRTTCFDESTGQWFVAGQTRVMVCQVKDKQVERKLYYLMIH